MTTITEFSQFKTIKDRHESLYIFVIYDMPPEQVNEKIHKMIGIVDTISNPGKRHYVKTRLYTMATFIEGIKKDDIMNGIYFLSADTVDECMLKKEWKDTLIYFQCDKFNVKYDNKFDLEWLTNFLQDTTFVDVIHAKNNNIKHYQLNGTKKRLHTEQTSKNMDLTEYIAKEIEPKKLCIVHGVSSMLKQMNDSSDGFIKVYKVDKRDDDILNEIDRLKNDGNSKELEQWLNKLLDPKQGNKIVFGVDINKNIKDKMLKTLFCSVEMEQKIKEGVPEEYRVFDVIVVKTFGDDVGKRLITDFRGAVGIKFY